MPKVVGLTGGFGTGKTSVASVFRSLGARVIDADAIARSTVAKGRNAYKKILAAFGPGVLGRAREIDRPRLAAIVFADPKALARLNRIVHPEVIDKIKRMIRGCGKHQVVVVDAPLLIEAGLAGITDLIVVVKAPREAQIRRCMNKFRMKRPDVIRRIKNQIPINRKIDMADFVVDNGGERSQTRRQVKMIWKEIVWR
jgi:dephospho-CoA kinase